MSYSSLDQEAMRCGSPSDGNHNCAIGSGDPPENKPRRWISSLGFTGAIILIIGTLTIAAGLTVLVFFWCGAQKARAEQLPWESWMSIVAAGWLTKVVTISTAIIRIAVAAQAGLMMAIMASIVLEEYGVPLRSAPSFSLLRVSSPSPTAVLISQGREMSRSSKLSVTLVFVVALITQATQFASTILVSDFDTVRILGGVNTSAVAYTSGKFEDITSMPYPDVWRSTPGPYLRFAEHSQPGGQGDYYEDTGSTFRAFIPFPSQQERAFVRNYTGRATAFDARVICTSPSLEISGITSYPDLTLEGYISVNSSATGNAIIPYGETTQCPFTCLIYAVENLYNLPMKSAWTTAICSPPDILYQFSGDNSSGVGRPAHMYLILNTTAYRNGSWKGLVPDDESKLNLSASDLKFVTTRKGTWTEASSAPASMVISVTACFRLDDAFDSEVSVFSTADAPEPTLAWEFVLQDLTNTDDAPSNVSNIEYDTSGVLRQLGADGSNTSHSDRGVLNLKVGRRYSGTEGYFSWTNNTSWICDFPTQYVSNMSGTTGSSALLDFRWSSLIHWGHVALFHDALLATGSPAHALQALFTSAAQMNYADLMTRFNIRSGASYVQSIDVQIPDRWFGLIVVTVIIAVHIILVCWITAWFLRLNDMTMLGNSWQAVAQVISGTTNPILLDSTNWRDADVRHRIKHIGGAKDLVRISRNVETGRSELVLVS